MTGSALGGGVIFVVAAILWVVVLVPAWVRRREFRVSERNAVRLQRTLRVLAETAEVPEEVQVEATARQALTHEKLMHSAKKRQEAERAAQVAEARAEQLRAQAQARQSLRRSASVERSVERAERLRRPAVRRVRVAVAFVAVLGFLGTLIGAGLLLVGSGAAVLLWSLVAGIAGFGSLIALAPGAPPAPAATVDPAPAPAAQNTPEVSEDRAPRTTSVSPAQHAAAQQAAAQRIARARALARAREARPIVRMNQPDSMLLAERMPAPDAAPTASTGSSDKPAKAAAIPPAPEPVARSAARAQQQAVSARLRRMGDIGDTSAGMPDLDEVLKRRRSAG